MENRKLQTKKCFMTLGSVLKTCYDCNLHIKPRLQLFCCSHQLYTPGVMSKFGASLWRHHLQSLYFYRTCPKYLYVKGHFFIVTMEQQAHEVKEGSTEKANRRIF
jgi:hypothetical protein